MQLLLSSPSICIEENNLKEYLNKYEYQFDDNIFLLLEQVEI